MWRYSAGSALALLFAALSLLEARPLGYLVGPAPITFSSAVVNYNQRLVIFFLEQFGKDENILQVCTLYISNDKLHTEH